MDDLNNGILSVIAYYSRYREIKILNIQLSEVQWKNKANREFLLVDENSMDEFKTWESFYEYLDSTRNRATILNLEGSANYKYLTKNEYKNTPLAQSIKYLIPGDLIKFSDGSTTMVDEFGLTNQMFERQYIGEPLHSYKCIYDKPLLYWETEEKYCTFLLKIPKEYIKIDIAKKYEYEFILLFVYHNIRYAFFGDHLHYLEHDRWVTSYKNEWRETLLKDFDFNKLISEYQVSHFLYSV